MRALSLAAALAVAGIGLLSAAGHEARAEAACRSVRDGSGNVRLRCDDGTTGILRNNGNGVLTGRVGNKMVRTLDNSNAGNSTEDSLRGVQSRGASGRGGTRNNSASGANSGCMSGGLRVTNCN